MSINKIEWRTPHNYDVDEATRADAITEPGESMTVQAMAEECDLNLIVKRYLSTGMLPESGKPVFYGDFEDIFDFRSAQEAVRRGQEAFDHLPADIRSRFGNDPQQFMEFCSASEDGKTLKNLEEMRKMGLAVPAKAEPTPEPTKEPAK